MTASRISAVTWSASWRGERRERVLGVRIVEPVQAEQAPLPEVVEADVPVAGLFRRKREIAPVGRDRRCTSPRSVLAPGNGKSDCVTRCFEIVGPVGLTGIRSAEHPAHRKAGAARARMRVVTPSRLHAPGRRRTSNGRLSPLRRGPEAARPGGIWSPADIKMSFPEPGVPLEDRPLPAGAAARRHAARRVAMADRRLRPGGSSQPHGAEPPE